MKNTTRRTSSLERGSPKQAVSSQIAKGESAHKGAKQHIRIEKKARAFEMENNRTREAPFKRRQSPAVVPAPIEPTSVVFQPSLISALNSLREAITSDRGEHRTNHRRNLADAYQLAFSINRDEDSKLLFEADSEWENFANTRIPKKDPAFILAAVLGYLFGTQNRPKKKKVSKLKKALEPYFVHGISPSEVRAIVVKGGVPALLRNASAFFDDGHKHEARSNKKRVTEAELEFDFDPGKYREQLMELDGSLTVQAKLKVVPKLNGKTVRLLSLNATA